MILNRISQYKPLYIWQILDSLEILQGVKMKHFDSPLDEDNCFVRSTERFSPWISCKGEVHVSIPIRPRYIYIYIYIYITTFLQVKYTFYSIYNIVS